MAIDLTKIQMSGETSSQKIIQEDAGSFAVTGLAGAGTQASSTVIPHPAGTDDLIVEVTSNTSYSVGTVLPWQSNDGRVTQYVAVDTSNLYIYCVLTSLAGAIPGFTLSYTYRIIAP